MRTRSVVVGVLATLLAVVPGMALPTAVSAQEEPCPSSQPLGDDESSGSPSQYPVGKCELRLSASVVVAGDSVGVAGSGFASRSSVRMALGAASVGTASAGPDGSFSRQVTVPATTEPGTYRMTATGPSASGGTQVLGAFLTVAGAGAPAAGAPAAGAPAGGRQPTGALPRTGGSDSVPLVVLGALLVAVGSAAVVTARRRRPVG